MKGKIEVQSRIQERAVQCWDNNQRRGILTMCTGSGKSKVAIDIIKRDREKLKKILLVVPTVRLRDTNWKEEFIKWKCKTLYNKIDRACYVSVNKIKGKEYDLVILDEGHNITQNNSQFFTNNLVRDILVLTATPPQDCEKVGLLNNLNCGIVFNYSLDEGVKDGVVAPYNIKVLSVPLEKKIRNVKAGTKKKPFMITEYKNYEYLCRKIAKSYYSNNPNLAKFASLDRMRFIYNLKSKTDIAKKIINNLSVDDRTLIFCGSIKQAEELCPYVYHSKTNDKDLIAFQDSKIDQLACVAALNEGMNIPNLDVGIIVQLNSRDLDLVQRIGRLIRYREGHTATIYILVSRDTQDEKWASKALAGFDPKRIKYIKL